MASGATKISLMNSLDPILNQPRSPLSTTVTLGQFLVEHYSYQMDDLGRIDIDNMLSDVMDLCKRFDIDFEAELKWARDRQQSR